MIYYLAGPMSGIAEQNYPAFQSACEQLRCLGLAIVSPHETVHHPTQPNEQGWRDLLRQDAKTLLQCQGVILLPGWAKSNGARFELYLALTLGLEVKLFKDGLLFDIS